MVTPEDDVLFLRNANMPARRAFHYGSKAAASSGRRVLAGVADILA